MIVIFCISFALLCVLVHIWATSWEDFNENRDDHCHNCPYGWCTDAPDPECEKWKDKKDEDMDKE